MTLGTASKKFRGHSEKLTTEELCLMPTTHPISGPNYTNPLIMTDQALIWLGRWVVRELVRSVGHLVGQPGQSIGLSETDRVGVAEQVKRLGSVGLGWSAGVDRVGQSIRLVGGFGQAGRSGQSDRLARRNFHLRMPLR